MKPLFLLMAPPQHAAQLLGTFEELQPCQKAGSSALDQCRRRSRPAHKGAAVTGGSTRT